MFKKILAVVAMMYAAVCFAAVDINKADGAELASIKGIGPAMSSKIIEARKTGQFKDWNNFIERVKGVGNVNAAKFSTEGLTVNGTPYKGTTAPIKAAAAPMGQAEMPKPAANVAKK
jgi:competence protein ComEA